MLVGSVPHLNTMHRVCTHVGGHQQSGGRVSDGRFATKGTEAYPSRLCHRLAELYVRAWVSREAAAAESRERAAFRGASAFAPSGQRRSRPLPPADV